MPVLPVLQGLSQEDVRNWAYQEQPLSTTQTNPQISKQLCYLVCIPTMPSNLKAEAGGMKMDVSLHYMTNPCKNKKKEIYDCLASEGNKGRIDTRAERISIGCEYVWLQRKHNREKRNEEIRQCRMDHNLCIIRVPSCCTACYCRNQMITMVSDVTIKNPTLNTYQSTAYYQNKLKIYSA